jgi:hypothetical protein
MPAGFDKCVEQGGYIRTIQKKGGKYQRTCSIKGKIFKSEIKKKKK